MAIVNGKEFKLTNRFPVLQQCIVGEERDAKSAPHNREIQHICAVTPEEMGKSIVILSSQIT